VVGVPDLPHPDSAIAPAASNGTDKIDIVDGFMIFSFSVRVSSIIRRELPEAGHRRGMTVKAKGVSIASYHKPRNVTNRLSAREYHEGHDDG